MVFENQKVDQRRGNTEREDINTYSRKSQTSLKKWQPVWLKQADIYQWTIPEITFCFLSLFFFFVCKAADHQGLSVLSCWVMWKMHFQQHATLPSSHSTNSWSALITDEIKNFNYQISVQLFKCNHFLLFFVKPNSELKTFIHLTAG